MSARKLVLRRFTIVPSDDAGFEVRIDPAIPDGTALIVRPTYDEAYEAAVSLAKLHGGGINKTQSVRRPA